MITLFTEFLKLNYFEIIAESHTVVRNNTERSYIPFS